MAVNKERPHIFVLPEDQANRQLANGFLLDSSVNLRAVQVLPNAHGWTKVCDEFVRVHLEELTRNEQRHIVLLVDFDRQVDRLEVVRKIIPESLHDRVFVLGVLSNPEDLVRAKLGKLEDIGLKLARDCRENTTVTWHIDLLKHNSEELERMTPILRPILFPQE